MVSEPWTFLLDQLSLFMLGPWDMVDSLCSDLNENGPHSLSCLNTLSLVGGGSILLDEPRSLGISSTL